MMRMLFVVVSLTLCCAVSTEAQRESGDKCHVYVVDAEAIRSATKDYEESRITEKHYEERMREGQIIFDEFVTLVEEESDTTKTFSLPKLGKIITASVYYTDESMASKAGVDSVLFGIVVADKAFESAINQEGSSMSEMTFSNFDTVRLKQYISIKNRRMLVGMECNSGAKDAKPTRNLP